MRTVIAALLLASSTLAVAEPATVVFKDKHGHTLTLHDLENFSGTVKWEIVGAEHVPDEARRLHEAGRASAQRNAYAEAQALFARAQKLAPSWPYPSYDSAFTYSLQGDFAKAEAAYVVVDRLAPRGFFTSKVSLDCLRRERAHALPPAFCQAYEALEWIDDKIKKRALLESIVAKFPGYAPAWRELATLVDSDEERRRAIEHGLSLATDVETHGMLIINQALFIAQHGEKARARALLVEVALDPKSTLATEALAKTTLVNLLGAPSKRE